MIKAIKIEILKNLSQLEYKDKYYDFHNDYNCVKISLNQKKEFELRFINVLNQKITRVLFFEVELSLFDFCDTSNKSSLTIDSLYRGRGLVGNKLIELSKNNKGYFYLEFDSGQKVEFWSIGFQVFND